jgi:hypothetical protein
MRVGILLTYGKDLHDHIISLRGEALAHSTSLSPPLLFYCNACSKPVELDAM